MFTEAGAGGEPLTTEEAFFDKIRQKDFPCVGAKSALANGRMKVMAARDLTSAWNDLAIHDALLDWAALDLAPDDLRSFAVIFEGPRDLSELAFERAMWERLQSLSDKDVWKHQPYDPSVSSDPESPDFSLSFGGSAFFVVGLHPHASRPARRFPNPTLVFNLHEQFERLREKGLYHRMRERILDRDVSLAGDINPMLAVHGESSEARQYSGRVVEADWRCPFHRRTP
ncbi:YqcI/YcgG family protein [Erythrobacteraceae bacterium CFH 75059]|uniref:guanitoxin biosynthesis heme-dependent pre-guanitoxin N-hydroxylase GntA n=1 Tax=Qipengyuania thermophila TaxID=2509361 RepID=UPI00102195CB|nr:guanitoxin biosynthesis heme-dependent pre-guanitoxin N-hydroxylase GntA [Qipengyuania thermophila]TCD04889.1 YqcI/YcgG family protein [Erythrobacteraceae bacterium CFH 75059]